MFSHGDLVEAVVALLASVAPVLVVARMQSPDAEPIVRIRDLKKNSVNFVLQNVDLSFVSFSHPPRLLGLMTVHPQIREFVPESHDGRHTHCR